jgi:hypothetical protein
MKKTVYLTKHILIYLLHLFIDQLDLYSYLLTSRKYCSLYAHHFFKFFRNYLSRLHHEPKHYSRRCQDVLKDYKQPTDFPQFGGACQKVLDARHEGRQTGGVCFFSMEVVRRSCSAWNSRHQQKTKWASYRQEGEIYALPSPRG